MTKTSAFLTIPPFPKPSNKPNNKPHKITSTSMRKARPWSAASPRPTRPSKSSQPPKATQAPTKADYTTGDPFKSPNTEQEARQNTSVNPVIILPGFGAPSTNYLGLQAELQRVLPAKASVTIVPVTVPTWLRTLGGRPVTPVLQLLHKCVQDACKTTGSEQVTIVAHSAGGWIARIYLGDSPYPDSKSGTRWKGHEKVSQLLTLGTPHKSGEGITRTNMKFVNENYPQAYHDDVDYCNFAGDAVPVTERSERSWAFWKPEWMARLSYSLTDAELEDGAAAVGDGIVPLSVAFLHGAFNVRLRGVWHSPDSAGPWYGHAQVVDYWSRFLK